MHRIENLNIPTKLSQLENDTKFITANDECIESKAPLVSPRFIGNVSIIGIYKGKTKINSLKNSFGL